jgi:hypothetical protein
MHRWVRTHERLFFSLFLPFIVLGAAGASLDGWLDAGRDARLTIALAWLVPLVSLGVYQLVLWRRGRLIITDPDERVIARERNARIAKVWMWPAMGLAAGLSGIGGAAHAVISGVLGGVMLAFTPLVLYIVFVIHADEHAGEHLDAGPLNRSSG